MIQLRRYLTFLALILLSATVHGSLMAIGPPAAPFLNYTLENLEAQISTSNSSTFLHYASSGPVLDPSISEGSNWYFLDPGLKRGKV
jgi:hypothetical protein